MARSVASARRDGARTLFYPAFAFARKEKLEMSKPRRRRKIGSKKRKARRDRRKR